MSINVFYFITFTFIHVLKDRSVDCCGAGPMTWSSKYPTCGGLRQSPVNINKYDVEYSSDLTHFQLNGYDDTTDIKMTLAKIGQQVDLEGRPIYFSGAGHSGVYVAKQFHFHMGLENKWGSEHTVNQHSFAMEMHIVHYALNYGTYETALQEPDGLAVLTFMFQAGRFNPSFEPLISRLDDMRFQKGDNILLESFPLLSIMSSNLVNYYRYNGSLTTPPCYESVVWTIFKTPVEISQEQLNRFRYYATSNNTNQTDYDFRPLQPLNGRRIFSSDPSDKPLNEISNDFNGNATSHMSHLTILSMVMFLSLTIIMMDINLGIHQSYLLQIFYICYLSLLQTQNFFSIFFVSLVCTINDVKK